MRGKRAALLFAAAACLAGATADTAPVVIRLGPDRLVLDSPPGFSDTTEFASPRLNEFAESLTEASNRILLFAVTDADARRFTVGDQLETRRYMVVATPRATERGRMSSQEFGSIVQDVMRALGAAPLAEDYMKYLQGRAAGPAHLLQVLRQEPHVVSLMQGTMLPRVETRENKEIPRQFRLSTTAMMLIGGKAVYLSVFSAYDSPADAAWIRTVTERWIEDLQRLNR